MELKQVDREEIASLREEHRRGSSLGIVPGFYSRLVEEAETFLIQEPDGPGEAPYTLGYVLSLERPHAGHSHVTVIELHLAPAYQTRYEDVLDLVKEGLGPTAYLVRTDDCRLNATFLARGLQMEATALVMLPEKEDRLSGSRRGRTPPGSGTGAAGPGVGGDAPGGTGVDLAVLTGEYLAALKELVVGESAPAGEHDVHRHEDMAGHGDTGGHGDTAGGEGAHSHSNADPAAAFAELETLARQGRNWVVLQQGRPVAVIARLDGGDGRHELLDFAVARAGEADLAVALDRAGEAVWSAGRRPAAVIDASEAARRRIFREAGYYSAAAYMVFYDPEAGRPSVGAVGVDELQAMIDEKEQFRLVDVLGEEHWREGHIPGSEWIDFKGLAREARRRFKAEEPIVLYCNGFT
ncbi:MAG: rhodanese-like domain-containing protein [bacterium]